MVTLPKDFKHSLDRLSFNIDDYLSSFYNKIPTSIRFNPHKTPSNLSILKQIPWCSNGYYLNERPNFTYDPLFHAGTYYVQEASSMFLEEVLKQTVDLNRNLIVLDLCGSPGGKSTLIQSCITTDSLLIANEVIQSRCHILSENIQKWGLHNAIVTNNDPSDFEKLPNFFDVILVDAPCSGEGMFRKNENAINEWSLNNVNLCSARQKRILSDIWCALKEDGVLIYSTCTFNSVENEENIEWLKNEFYAEPIEINTKNFPNIVNEAFFGIHGARFYPQNIEGEGFFICAVRKTKSEKNSYKFKNEFKKVKFQKNDVANDFIIQKQNLSVYEFNKGLYVLNNNHIELTELIYSLLKVNYISVCIAEIKGKSINPTHGLALYNNINNLHFNSINLNYKDAISFLKKENIHFYEPQDGWNLLKYEGFNLGWLKKNGNRSNNYYPKEWRIRH